MIYRIRLITVLRTKFLIKSNQKNKNSTHLHIFRNIFHKLFCYFHSENKQVVDFLFHERGDTSRDEKLRRIIIIICLHRYTNNYMNWPLYTYT